MGVQLDRLKAALADRYAIDEEIGSGGMATVYLAEDLKHHRKVAVKVLRPDLAATLGPDRFLREIEVAAQLHHPHILPLYDSGDADGFLYYVMPYEEGQSLREKLAREGELPVPEAVRVLKDVVDALAHAHEHHVVHRDIKPDNVLLSGHHALVTDFGVAKAISEATGREKLTTAGVALGTPSYMAPEQAAADPHIDHRADIYAVGALAYELLTGRPPFTGTSPQMILAAHISETPEPVNKHREAVPAALNQLVMKCLEKKAADRWQSAQDLLPQLEVLATPSGGTTPTGTTPVPRVHPRWRLNVPVLTGVTVAIAVIGFFGWSSMRIGGPTVSVSNIRQLTRAPEIEYEPAISPDGGEVAYTAGFGTDLHIFIRDLGGGRSIPLTADRPGRQEYPRWAPDGRSLVFVQIGGAIGLDLTRGTSQLIPRFGGSTRPIVEGFVWGVHGDRVTYIRGDSILVQRIDGGAATLVARAAPQPHSVAWSPDGSRLAYVQGNGDFIRAETLGNIAPSSIWIVDVDGGEPVEVTEHLSLNVSPAWLPDGRHLMFISNRDGPRDLYVVAVDGSGRPEGEPVGITVGLDPHSVSVAADGSVAAYSQFTLRRNVWEVAIPASGSVSIGDARQVTLGNQVAESHRVSPDGQWLAYDSNLEGNQDIFIMPIGGGEPRQVTTDLGDDFVPEFSPDGREIAFFSMRHGNRDVFLIGVDGNNEVRLTDGPDEEQHPTFSPDGLRIAFHIQGATSAQIFVMSRESIGAEWSTPQQLTKGGGTHQRWAPDGDRLVYDMGNAIGVVTLEGEETQLLDGAVAGFDGVVKPDWSRDGRFIYFSAIRTDGSQGLYSVPAAGGEPRLLVRYDDPATQVFVFGFSVGDGKVYLTVSEFESDIYVMDLAIN